MNKLIFIPIMMFLVACSVPNKPTLPQDAIICSNKQDKKLDFIYLPQNATQWHSEYYDVNIYLIDTIDGKQIAINSLELENYVCTTGVR